MKRSHKIVFSFGIKGRGGFIQNQYARFPQEAARDRDTLFLTDRYLARRCAELRIVAIGQLVDELVCTCDPGDPFYLRKFGPRITKANIVGNLIGHQFRFLKNVGDLPSETLQGHVADVVPVDQYAPLRRDKISWY